MSDEEFRVLRDFINGHCGLYFDSPSRYLLEKRLSKRVQELQLSGFKEYHYYLRYDNKRDDELSCIVDVLTTNETYFFRESYQLNVLRDEILPELHAKKKDKTLRIWSAGSSTGEEAYTIGIIILETGLFDEWDVEVVGSDISQRVLHVARRGAYSDSSFRVTSEEHKEKFFFDGDDGKRHVIDKVRNMVTFGMVNLLDSNRINLIPTMDLIFCRNVIIYFDLQTKKKVMESFYHKLHQGGYLLLGHSESLINISTSFKLKHLKNDMVYQKPDLLENSGDMGALS